MMIFWWLIILIPIGAVIWWAVTANQHKSAPKEDDPMKILEDRFAKGEIDKEEFEEKKKTLLR